MENKKNISTDNSICNGFGQEAGCLHHPSRQDAMGSAGIYQHAYLRYQFGLFRPIVSYPELAQSTKIERGFFRSLQNLCDLYNLSLPDTTDIPYPDNIAVSFSIVKQEFETLNHDLQLAILQTHRSTTFVGTIKSNYTGYDLYFFPVSEIYFQWQKDEKSLFSDLVLNLFAFLKQQLEVPFYAEAYSFLNDCYRTIREYIEGDIEHGYEYEDDLGYELLEEIDFIDHAGNEILKEISKTLSIEKFESKIKSFKPRNDREASILAACKKALTLKRKYPNISIGTAIPDFYDGDEENILRPDMYIGFVWGGESDWLENNLNEQIHSYLNEFSDKQEPSSAQIFNRKISREKHNLKMQKELIAFFDQVAKALYAYYEF